MSLRLTGHKNLCFFTSGTIETRVYSEEQDYHLLPILSYTLAVLNFRC